MCIYIRTYMNIYIYIYMYVYIYIHIRICCMGKPLYKESLCEVVTIQGMDLWGRSHSIKNLYVGR